MIDNKQLNNQDAPGVVSQTPCYGADNLFKCTYCGTDFFTYKNNRLYCECGMVYDLSGDEPAIVA